MSEEPKRTEISGEQPIILPTPVAVVHAPENKTVTLTRLFSWLTGLTLSISVLVSLVNVIGERNNLQNQLTCRANANFQASKASYEKQVALADHSVLVGKVIVVSLRVSPEDPTRLTQLNDLADQIETADVKLSEASEKLREAIGQQQASLTNC